MPAAPSRFRLNSVVVSAVSDVPSPEVAVADTVGAGDAFTAAMTLGLLAGRHIEQVNCNAIAAAA
ncbi:MAG: PfkB family carbohydrate kinase [Planctomycetota bacterium]